MKKQWRFQWMIIMVLVSKKVGAEINTNELNEIKDSLLNNIQDGGVSIPPELMNIDLEKGTKQAADIFKQKCIDNSGSDAAFEEASQATTTFIECVQHIVDINQLQKEIEEAKPNGNLDTVFNKYCDKRSVGVSCVESFTTSIDPCLTQEEKNHKKIFINITISLLEFVCHENGNQIALFFAEEGPECFELKKENLMSCFNKTMGKYVGNELPTLENLPTLVIKEENCEDMDKLEECIVLELEKCKESTPANLMEALFRFLRKETPCGKRKIKSSSNSNQNLKSSITFSIFTILNIIIKL